MKAPARGFLLLSSHLGNSERRVLTVAQLRDLSKRVRSAPMPDELRELELRDIAALGYGPSMAQQILALLQEEDLLNWYLEKAVQNGCVPLTRADGQYPRLLRQRLGLDSPGVLWAKGDLTLLEGKGISLVGSRDIAPANRAFAAEVGHQAARQGRVLISGNARGADRTAQENCLASDGQVISIVADELWKHRSINGMLYLSENGWDEPFSAQRALSRNRCIHALGEKTFVAQVRSGMGGTWDGTVKNLHRHWSPVYGFRDDSAGMQALEQMGATLIETGDLGDFEGLPKPEENLLDEI